MVAIGNMLLFLLKEGWTTHNWWFCQPAGVFWAAVYSRALGCAEYLPASLRALG